MVGEIKAAVDPDAVSTDFLILLRVNRPLTWLRNVVHAAHPRAPFINDDA